ncbi:Uncharacterized protein PCOAH_00044330 [Plasmodium coatneyi]|uniref:Uncharacterized protein n=1 Tax=Plasmodium coatneyi TaxID=208452 RepID=A0A1B1E5W6_9APIC|nr:Uncharacterized protein PCOAH_00044330 [Plasmodium coatneyi]ANQ10385.1 Uncharacterized protein PCOAH_00044330 [Plasmodium coatneyi]
MSTSLPDNSGEHLASLDVKKKKKKKTRDVKDDGGVKQCPVGKSPVKDRTKKRERKRDKKEKKEIFQTTPNSQNVENGESSPSGPHNIRVNEDAEDCYRKEQNEQLVEGEEADDLTTRIGVPTEDPHTNQNFEKKKKKKKKKKKRKKGEGDEQDDHNNGEAEEERPMSKAKEETEKKVEAQHEVDINHVNSQIKDEKDVPSNGENNIEGEAPGTGGYIISGRDLAKGTTSVIRKGNTESAEIKSTMKEKKGGRENCTLHNRNASCGSDAHEQAQVKCNQGDTQLDETENQVGQKEEKESQSEGKEFHTQEKENRDISEGQLNGAGQCAEGALLEVETMHSLRDSEKKEEERKKKNKKKKDDPTKGESKKNKRRKDKEKRKEAWTEDKTTEAINESEHAKEESTEKNEELLISPTGEVQESVEYTTDSIARTNSKKEIDSNGGATPRGGSLHKMCLSNGVKHLETYESKVCVANSFHDISSPASENEETQQGSYTAESASYGENRKSFDLLSYIENGIKNYVNMLKEENVEIYERKCVKEMIAFHKLKLKYLKKKKKKIKQNIHVESFTSNCGSHTSQSTSEEDKEEIIRNFGRFDSFTLGHAEEGSSSSATTHNKSRNIKSRNENAHLGKKSSKSKNQCSKQTPWCSENDRLGSTTAVQVKKTKRRGANKSSDELSPGKMDTSSLKDMEVESQLEEFGCAESARRGWVPPSNGAEVKRECNAAVLQNKSLATPNEDLNMGESPSSKNVFESLFHFYAKDKANVEPEGKTRRAGCYAKGMDLELFLNFSKHYKIIKSLLTKSELEKIFLNESKGNAYIQGRQFQKVLMLCAQIAFTKPPHRVNFTDTKKIFQCLITWLCNNAPEQQKKIILKSCQLADVSMLTENGKSTEPQKAEVKGSTLRNKQYSISVKDKSKKPPINNIVLTSSQNFETPSKKLEKAKIFRYNTSVNLRK